MINHSDNISNSLENYIILPSLNKKNSNKISSKYDIHYTPAQNEWTTSSYNFNKNILRNLPSKDLVTYKLLSAYFNMKIKRSKVFFGISSFKPENTQIDNRQYLDYIESFVYNQKNKVEKTNIDNPFFNKELLKKLGNKSKKRIIKKNRFSVQKTFISKPESKHLNYKLIVTVSLYNREIFLLKKKIVNMFESLFFINKFKKLKKVLIRSNESRNIIFKSNFITETNQNKLFSYINKNKINFPRKSVSVISKYHNHKNSISEQLFSKENIQQHGELVSNNFFSSKKEKIIKYFINNKFRSLLIFKYFMLMWCLHNYKFNNNNLIGLRNIISKIYNKKPYFKLINLRYFYLDSNILASLITKKLKDRKKKVLIILNKALAKVRKFKHLTIWNGKLYLNNLLSQYEDENRLLNYSEMMSDSSLGENVTNKNMVYYKDFLLRNKKDIVSVILHNTKNKVLNGIRLQGTGRLTKRLTALRSVSKTKYVGSLKNINSSSLGLSTILLKGYCKSNLQYTNINSYNRNGSFGVKTSIASF